MLLFKKAFWDGLQRGAITLTFRRWQKPHVKPGGRYRCHPIGVLEVDDVQLVTAASISDDDARRAGFDTRGALLDYLAELGPLDDATPVHRVTLHHGGDGDRVALALDDVLSADDVAAIRARLARLDRDGAWTAKTLAIIGRRPRVAASKLAAALGRDTASFKTDVRKLKKLGLTQSFEVGYEISPRGRAYLTLGRGARSGRGQPRSRSRSPGRAPARKATGSRARRRRAPRRGCRGSAPTCSAACPGPGGGPRAAARRARRPRRPTGSRAARVGPRAATRPTRRW
jgi:hypothetical protein